MALRNRVTPTGELRAVPDRGLVYGNRGCLHDAEGRIRRAYAVRRWIACRLEFKDRRRRQQMPPGRYTGLYFLDEATAFAAGHRPCAECRRAAYVRFGELWRTAHPDDRGADAIDSTLHAERWSDGAQRQHAASYADLPDGSMVTIGDAPWLVFGPTLRRWTPAGYADRIDRPSGTATVLTPPTIRAILATGWATDLPLVDPSGFSG